MIQIDTKDIEFQATRLLESSGCLDSVPVDPYYVAMLTGLQVKHMDTTKVEWPGGLSPFQIHGLYERDENRILVSHILPRHRKNFTIAHEIGHHVLHNTGALFRLDKYDYDIQDTGEQAEANCFAACLLMPKKSIIKKWEQNRQHVTLMAIDFNVSKPVMEARLKELKFIWR